MQTRLALLAPCLVTAMVGVGFAAPARPGLAPAEGADSLWSVVAPASTAAARA